MAESTSWYEAAPTKVNEYEPPGARSPESNSPMPELSVTEWLDRLDPGNVQTTVFPCAPVVAVGENPASVTAISHIWSASVLSLPVELLNPTDHTFPPETAVTP